ncbi:MAG TPA: cytidine deaminase [Methylocella sp.]|nr:cytidine deaminase [Methylocella sp.]
MGAIEALFTQAAKARMNAHAPYSGFAVGAALRTKSGAVFSGANVENAAYPNGTCAETAAIAAMVTAGERRIAELLVIGTGEALVTPCGACRQRIAEFAEKEAQIFIADLNGVRRIFTLGELLPEAFRPALPKARTP